MFTRFANNFEIFSKDFLLMLKVYFDLFYNLKFFFYRLQNSYLLCATNSKNRIHIDFSERLINSIVSFLHKSFFSSIIINQVVDISRFFTNFRTFELSQIL